MEYEGKKLIQFNYEVSDMGSWVNAEVFSLTGKARRGIVWWQRGYMGTNSEVLFRYIDFKNPVRQDE